MMIFWAPRRVLVLIQVGVKKQDCGPAVREFAPPYEVSAGDGVAMFRTHRIKTQSIFYPVSIAARDSKTKKDTFCFVDQFRG